jgi:hypothetical protein
MNIKKRGLLIVIIVISFRIYGQQQQPYPNLLLMPVYTPTNVTTPTSAPNAPYNNPAGGSTTPYTTGPLKQETGPPPALNPPPLNPPSNPMTSPTIIEPAKQPIPPPIDSTRKIL